MAPATPPLRRLVSRDIGPLLSTVAADVPGLALAVVAGDGTVAWTGGDWPGGTPGDVPDHTSSYELTARGERVGSLIAGGDVPLHLLEAVGRSVSLLLADALDKHDLARETLERYRELNLLYRASATIGASLDAEEVARLLLVEAQQVIPSDRAIFLLRDATLESDWVKAAGLLDHVRTTGRPDIGVWTEADGGGDLGSALCVPVRAGEKVLGAVVLGRRLGSPIFTAGDEKLLLGLASQAGLALERAWLHEQETRRLQLEEELAVARRIQLTLLPSAPPAVPGWGFAATYQAARQVGGDFYDFLDHALDRRRLGIVIADVTGKGVPAALVMAYSRAVLRAQAMAGSSAADLLAETNRVIMRERQSRLFLSAFYAEIDLDSGLLTYASAGHDAPLWIAAGGAETRELEAPGVVLGAFNDMGLESRSVRLEPGDTVLLFTDGVTEARDPQRRLFGEERLTTAAKDAAAAGASAATILEMVLTAVAEFTAGAEQADDLTMVVVQRGRHDGD